MPGLQHRPKQLRRVRQVVPERVGLYGWELHVLDGRGGVQWILRE
jgi:hypothetical protein